MLAVYFSLLLIHRFTWDLFRLIAYGVLITQNFARFWNICESWMICFWFNSTTFLRVFSCFFCTFTAQIAKKRPRLTYMNHMISSVSISRERQKKKTRETSCHFNKPTNHNSPDIRFKVALCAQTATVWCMKGFCFESNATRHAAMRKPDFNWQFKFPLPQWL